MQAVHIDNIEVGMVLSDDVRDISSRLLLSSGNAIGSRHIRVFKIWGITEILVEGAHIGRTPVPDPISSEERETIQAALKQRFIHNRPEHPAVRELLRIAAEHFQRRPLPPPRRLPEPEETAQRQKPPAKCNLRKALEGAAIKLPEMPSIVSELNEVIASPFASASDIARIVNKSPSLTTLLLKIVNSALYGFSSKIDSISRAVTMVGSKEITGLAIGISAMRMFSDIPKEIIDMPSFLRHSLACGIIGRILAAYKNIPHTERLFVSGLLHDIGRLVVYRYFPHQGKSVLHRAMTAEQPLYRVEKKELGCRHTDIARYLLTRWKLPFALENNIVYHHHPAAAHEPVGASIVHLADIMTNSLSLGSSGESVVPPLDETAWDLLKISPGVFKRVVGQALHQLASLENFLTVDNESPALRPGTEA